MYTSSLRYLTDEELLRSVSELQHRSPVIFELARRLADKQIPLPLEVPEIMTHLDSMIGNIPLCCPVCKSSLRVRTVQTETDYTVKLE